MSNGTHTAKKKRSKPNIWLCISLNEWIYDECPDAELNSLAYDFCEKMDKLRTVEGK